MGANRLQPYCVPEGIITYPPHQSGADRICHNIARDRSNVFISTQRVIMISSLPYSTCADKDAIYMSGARGFQTSYNRGKIGDSTNLDQPMHVIRHEYPRQHAGVNEYTVILKTACRGASGRVVHKYWFPGICGGSDVVNLSRQGCPAVAQGPMPRFVCWLFHIRITKGIFL